MSITLLESMKAKVKNVHAVKKVLDNYWYEFEIEIETYDGVQSGSLTIAGFECRPWAVPMEAWPEPDEFPDEDAWDDATENLLSAQGDAGFLALLRDLAPYLETPLTVVWHGEFEGHFGGAGQWTVWPDSPYVQVQKVDPLLNS